MGGCCPRRGTPPAPPAVEPPAVEPPARPRTQAVHLRGWERPPMSCIFRQRIVRTGTQASWADADEVHMTDTDLDSDDSP